MLIIGPKYNKRNSSKTGGIVVLFEDWIEYCKKNDFSYSIVDTNKANYCNIVIAYLSIVSQIIWKSAHNNIIFFNGTLKDYLYIAPIVIIIGKIFNKKVCIRKFAGSFEEYYNQTTAFRKRILKYIVSNADIAFWETKSLVRFGLTINQKSYWFPNIRHESNIKRCLENKFSKRFIFLSQVKKEKGVEYLLKSFRLLDKSYQLDIFGPLIDVDIKEFKDENISYKGSASPENVCKTLSEYDVLVLPTYWKNEGYPGIIIEAFSVGIPVIATTVGGIPEIVKDKYNGILVPPKDVEALCDAIKYFNVSIYHDMARNALESFNEFDSEIVNNRILKIIEEK